ncbi:MAG: IS1595 family transposase [Chloroflexi bacterium]|nr:IS1595 family transposase [Chloroflexota bacterium]
MPMKSMTMMHLMERFGSEKECRDVLAELRWPSGVICPRCNGTKQAFDSERYTYDCYSCGYQFSALVGTIFHDTKLPLREWFMAVLLMVEAKKGISANQMKRILGVSYKTAWYLCHRIRAAMAEVNAAQLGGQIEVDETFVGGKVQGKGHGYKGNKAVVVGVVQRKGEVRLQVASGTDRATLHRIIHQHVKPDAPNIYTDEWAAYKGIGDADTAHETVNHKAEEWVRGDAHTQTVESVWSLLKRSIVGSYHKVSVKHLDAYLDELEWRFNNRENKYLFRDTLMRLLKSPNLEYKSLTA